MEDNSVIENKILIYESDENIKVEVILEDENIWLTQDQISKLYNKAKSTINEHIKNIYSERELLEANTMRKFGNSEFSTKQKNYYNLDILKDAGKISHEIACDKALTEFEKYRVKQDKLYKSDFDLLLEEIDK